MIIRLTVANEMLSLLGSIQVDPFSPEHVPETGPSTRRAPSVSDIEEVEREVVVDVEEEEEDEIESDEDTFKALGKMTDEAAIQAKREAEEAAQAEQPAKEKKRKRKADKPEGKTKKKKT